MQILSVLKGCLAAFLVGVLFNWAGQLLSSAQGSGLGMGVWDSLWFTIVFGAVLALPLTLAVLALWAVLARRGTTVSYRDALITGAGGTVLVFWAVGNPLLWLLIGVLLGAALGAAFWLAAFGFRREVALTLT